MEEPEQILQGEREEEEEEEDYGVTEKVNEFFTELDIEQEQRRRRLRSEGVRVGFIIDMVLFIYIIYYYNFIMHSW